MNKVIMIGNLARDPELRTVNTAAGPVSVCKLVIAVNRRRGSNADANQPEADFVNVTVWRQQGENCAKYLTKGRKIGVVGTVGCSAYMGKDNLPHASLEVTADEVEFLSSRNDAAAPAPAAVPVAPAAPAQQYGAAPQGNSFVSMDAGEELPF